MKAGADRSALVVYESMFDNTAHVAEAIARGLERAGFEAHAVPVTSLAASGPMKVDLLAVGAPTHTFTLSRRETRVDAARRGAPSGRVAIGLRDWIAGVTPGRFGTERVVVFDTRVTRVRRLRLAAGVTAARLLRRRGFRLLRKPVAFMVDETSGPLREGEVARAERWGQMMGAACRDDLAAA
ncbi:MULTISPECIES: flavodoxin family protein [unclassified Nocardioides]|uniref:flavodoxin family protein n=1 Tax=unclassified Nocardioides TaxID=2615069 RepID=UPI0006F35D63|nr:MULTISPECIES: hypothetical protein [unclassified Nocardioides]KRA32442.1 hypothetical protein ASD81_12810 [Nocardioides sp. Root614]KRA89095.1 hypothetical protein ASD84_13075 [Nocardioides sp. Root682]